MVLKKTTNYAEKKKKKKKFSYHGEKSLLTIVKELHACSINPMRPVSEKYLPVQIPSSSGETTSSDTALSSRTFEEIFWEKKINKTFILFYKINQQCYICI